MAHRMAYEGYFWKFRVKIYQDLLSSTINAHS